MILGFFSDMGKFFSDNPWYLVIVIAVLIIAIAVAFAISGLKKKGEKKPSQMKLIKTLISQLPKAALLI